MDINDLVVNSRYVPKSSIRGLKINVYVLNNGVLKKAIVSPLLSKSTPKNNLWYRLEDLPSELQLALEDVSISVVDLMAKFGSKKSSNDIFDNDNTKIYVSSNTKLLPVVGNILPSDGVPAFTVIMDGNRPKLKGIPVCWNCHWSELFSGTTKYGENVFCLASDLSDGQKELYKEDIITLSDTPKFLGLNQDKTL